MLLGVPCSVLCPACPDSEGCRLRAFMRDYFQENQVLGITATAASPMAELGLTPL